MKNIVRYALNHVPRPVIQRMVHLAMPLMGVWYSGRGRQCPVCSRRYRRFMPYGYGPVRENALCPGCLALERHRLLWLYLDNETDFFSRPLNVLHIAPERCFIRKFEAMHGVGYITADLESPLAKVKMDIQAMPFPDDSFDVVFCNHILEHVDDDRLAMRELYRVMKPGGWGIMLSPVNPSRENTYEDHSIVSPHARAAAFGQHDHLRDYGRDYGDRLREAGFAVDEIDYAERFASEDKTKYGLRNEIIYVGRKN